MLRNNAWQSIKLGFGMDHSQNVRDFWRDNLQPIIDEFLNSTTPSKPSTFCGIVFTVLWWKFCLYTKSQLSFDAHVTKDLQMLLGYLESEIKCESTTDRLIRLCRTIEKMHGVLKDAEEGNPDLRAYSFMFRDTVRNFFGVLLGSYLEEFVYRYYKDNHTRKHEYTDYIEVFANEVQLQFSDLKQEGNDLEFFKHAEIFFAEHGRGNRIITEALQFIKERDARDTRLWFAEQEDRDMQQKRATEQVIAEQAQRKRDIQDREDDIERNAMARFAARMLLLHNAQERIEADQIAAAKQVADQRHATPESAQRYVRECSAMNTTLPYKPMPSNPYMIAERISAFGLQD